MSRVDYSKWKGLGDEEDAEEEFELANRIGDMHVERVYYESYMRGEDPKGGPPEKAHTKAAPPEPTKAMAPPPPPCEKPKSPEKAATSPEERPETENVDPQLDWRRQELAKMKKIPVYDARVTEFEALKKGLGQVKARSEFIAREARSAVVDMRLKHYETSDKKIGDVKLTGTHLSDEEAEKLKASLEADLDRELQLSFREAGVDVDIS